LKPNYLSRFKPNGSPCGEPSADRQGIMASRRNFNRGIMRPVKLEVPSNREGIMATRQRGDHQASSFDDGIGSIRTTWLRIA
jgi:hypothetical protein